MVVRSLARPAKRSGMILPLWRSLTRFRRAYEHRPTPLCWNGQWLDLGGTAAGIGWGSLRRVVEQVVDAAPAECRNAEALGPWFIPIPEGDRTVTIVIGSGIWHWADLIASSADCPVAASAACRSGTMIQNAD